MSVLKRFVWSGLICGWLLAIPVGARAGERDAAHIEFFEAKIRPVLVEQCQGCHGAKSQPVRGNLRLDRRDGLLKGGDLGAAVVPGKPEESILFSAITHRDADLKMPLEKPKLDDKVIDDFREWIANGAAWPEEETTEAKSESFDLASRKRELPWIWETPTKNPRPTVRQADWPRAASDSFLLSRLELAGLAPAPDAPPHIWLRRVHFALVGLPPTPTELADFLRDPSLAARERVVDRLLDSPRFGERWARHWLDLVRYAESRGHESDFIIPNAYEYRDYIVRALNADLPYDEFVREHLAGDLLPLPRRNPTTGANESIIATGWAFLGEEIHAPVDTRLDETERIDNRIDVLSKTFLGLTVSCARCHDHKFDAISQRDYYALAGFFISTGQRLARFEAMEQEREAALELAELHKKREPELKAAIREAQVAVLKQLKVYLTVAIKGLQTAGLPAPEPGKKIRPGEFTQPANDALDRLAVEATISAPLLKQWVAVLWNAVNDRNDALHALARSATSQEVPNEPSTSKRQEIGLDDSARIVVDYREVTSPGSDWSMDGMAFGTGPSAVFALRFLPAAEMARPTVRVVTIASANTEPDWRRLDLAPGTEREPTIYGSWNRDGAMLRSPKFELQTGRLYYLVRGSGRVLAAVDSQRLVTGPIHTGIVREWGFNDQWHWISHDLSAYQGHRVAIEFSPHNEFDTSIALIVESDTPPREPLTAGRFVAQSATENRISGTESLVGFYQKLLLMAVNSTELPIERRYRQYPANLRELIGAQYILREDQRSHSLPEIARWLTQHPELISGRDGEWPESVSQKLAAYQQERETILKRVPWQSRTVPAMIDGNGVDEYLLVRGKHQRTKGLVPRRSLEALSGPEPLAHAAGSGRFELARELTDPRNSLIGRVIVNRVWHYLFGRGIVATPDNFGVLGMRATHPELLDDLAATFVSDDQWSLKRLIRKLVLSRAFAMSSDPDDAAAEQNDPENVLLHRMNLKRLEGEAIRDAILMVSGRLDDRMGGVSVPLHPSQFIEARGLRGERGPLDGGGRRSLYVAARRNFLPTMMTAFDTPTPFTTVGRRNVSNVPGQMLFLMNDPFVHEQSQVWARRLLADVPANSTAPRVRSLFLSALSREPSAEEVARCEELLQQTAEVLGVKEPTLESWTELCHAMFAVKEFLFVR